MRTPRAPAARTGDRTRTWPLVVALTAVLAAAGCIAASGLVWISVPDGTGGRTAISGWGGVSGGQIDGQNINDLMSGYASFRPGLLAGLVGIIALLAALGIAVPARGRRPHRIPAAALAICGLTGLVWGLVRGVSPSDLAGVLNAGEGSSGAGPWLTAGCSLIILAAAGVVFTGLLDPPQPTGRRGIRSR